MTPLPFLGAGVKLHLFEAKKQGSRWQEKPRRAGEQGKHEEHKGRMAEGMAEKTKDQRIKAERRKLLKTFEDIPPAKKQMMLGLVERAAFMRVELEDMEQDLNENGWTEKFQQGSAPAYDRARPIGQAYNTVNANYQKIIKQLEAMVPAKATASDEDSFDGFVIGRDEL